MKFAIAVLFGLASAYEGEPVWSLRSVNDHRTDSEIQKGYGDHSTKQANGRPPYQSAVHLQDSSDSDSDSDEDVQLNGEPKEEVDHSGEIFAAGDHGQLGEGGYERVATPRFSADSDDIFMRSMIMNYASEHKNKDGSPNGTFSVSEAAASAAAREVLATHKGMTGAALEDYMKTYWARSWAHFDVNRTGAIEVIKMPQVMRFLASDQQMYLW